MKMEYIYKTKTVTKTKFILVNSINLIHLDYSFNIALKNNDINNCYYTRL